MVALVVILVVLVVAELIAAGRSFKVVQQYEQGIIFRFGRVLRGTPGAGLTLIRPVGDRMQKCPWCRRPAGSPRAPAAQAS